MKLVTVNGFFPEVAASRAFASATGKGSNTALALYRAEKQLLKSPGIKGHRISGFKLTVSVIDVKEKEESHE